jgi:hypothetical protein
MCKMIEEKWMGFGQDFTPSVAEWLAPLSGV